MTTASPLSWSSSGINSFLHSLYEAISGQRFGLFIALCIPLPHLRSLAQINLFHLRLATIILAIMVRLILKSVVGALKANPGLAGTMTWDASVFVNLSN